MSKQDRERARWLIDNGYSLCTLCREIKELVEFPTSSTRYGGVGSRCRKCVLVVSQIARRLKNTGWTQDEYLEAHVRQNGLCAICNQPEPRENRALSADHCHATGGKRGLLCSNCNLGLGNFKDNPALLESAILYLKGL